MWRGRKNTTSGTLGNTGRKKEARKMEQKAEGQDIEEKQIQNCKKNAIDRKELKTIILQQAYQAWKKLFQTNVPGGQLSENAGCILETVDHTSLEEKLFSKSGQEKSLKIIFSGQSA